MGGHREQVDAEGPHVDGYLADRLHRVGVHQRAALVGDGGNLGNRLDGPDLVVCVHDRDERGVVGHRLPDPVGRDDAPLVDRDQGRPPAAAGQGLEGVQDRFVLDGAGHEVAASGGLGGFGRAADGEVVGLGSAAREYNF